MKLELEGRITVIGEPFVGNSKAGKEYRMQDFVIKTDEKYSKEVCFKVFNDSLDFLYGRKVGDKVTVEFSVESKEYNGKWFTNALAFGVKGDKQDDETTPKHEYDNAGNTGLPPSESMTTEKFERLPIKEKAYTEDEEDLGLPF